MKRIKNIAGCALPAVIALCLILTASAVDGTSAYFTTHTGAAGGKIVTVNAGGGIIEEIEGTDKLVQVENTGNIPCFARVKVMCGEHIARILSFSGENWATGVSADGYLYYDGEIPAGGISPTLKITVDTGSIPEEFSEEDFNIVVVSEIVPAFYDDAGNPQWNEVTVQ